MKAPDDYNDELRKQVETEFPKPAGGFETEMQWEEWRAKSEARYKQLVWLSSNPYPKGRWT